MLAATYFTKGILKKKTCTIFCQDLVKSPELRIFWNTHAPNYNCSNRYILNMCKSQTTKHDTVSLEKKYIRELEYILHKRYKFLERKEKVYMDCSSKSLSLQQSNMRDIDNLDMHTYNLDIVESKDKQISQFEYDYKRTFFTSSLNCTYAIPIKVLKGHTNNAHPFTFKKLSQLNSTYARHNETIQIHTVSEMNSSIIYPHIFDTKYSDKNASYALNQKNITFSNSPSAPRKVKLNPKGKANIKHSDSKRSLPVLNNENLEVLDISSNIDVMQKSEGTAITSEPFHDNSKSAIIELNRALTLTHNSQTFDHIKHMIKMLDKFDLNNEVYPVWNLKKICDMYECKIASQSIRSLNKHVSSYNAEKNFRKFKRNRKDALLLQETVAYLTACIDIGKVEKAHAFLFAQVKKHDLKSKRAFPYSLKIEAYNIVIGAWARKQNYTMIENILTEMKKNRIQPDLQTYSYCLLCLGRVTDIDAMKKVSSIFKKMDELDMSVLSLLNQCASYETDEFDIIKKLVFQFKPDCEVVNICPSSMYKVDILDSLNRKDECISTNPHAGIISTGDISNQIESNLKSEIKGTATVKSISASSIKDNLNQVQYRNRIATLKVQWHQSLSESLDNNIKFLKLSELDSSKMSLSVLLSVIPSEKITEYLLLEIEKLLLEEKSYVPVPKLLHKSLGMRICNDYLIQRMIKNEKFKNTKSLYNEFLLEYNSDRLNGKNHREIWEELKHNNPDYIHIDPNHVYWSSKMCQDIGKFLYSLILSHVKVDSDILKNSDSGKHVPAFYLVSRFDSKMNSWETIYKPHPDLIQLYEYANLEYLTFLSSDMPSLIPPVPRCSVSIGGNMFSTMNIVRYTDMHNEMLSKYNCLPKENMFPILDALNAVSHTPWIINKPVLDLIIKVFNDGGDPDIDIPRPSSSFPNLPRLEKHLTKDELKKLKKEREIIVKEKKESHSLWMTVLYRLSIANKFRDDIFWFPHDLDFRGRSYTVPAQINHIGPDNGRSVLMFAKGKPLGKDGLDWLKIHAINLTGFKKRSSNMEKLVYANEILSDLLNSANNPMDGNQLWRLADEPWQFLACCLEIRDALNCDDAVNFISHLPVHQDGSCNGLQHYAALGRDQAGGESVNLCPFERPKDVYSDVVELVEKQRKIDASNGHRIAQVLEGYVYRKVIKQTIMTTVYGVTSYGSRLQIRGQLKEIPDFPKSDLSEASSYLSGLTFTMLKTMFLSTKEIQDWLTISSEMLTSIANIPVTWVTPLGFPVIQPYLKKETISKVGKDKIVHKEVILRPSNQKQKNGFAPNFIHSLDSTHMMLTAIFCLRHGITFASIHDCFWTHACDVATLSKITRDQFLALHNKPILEDLSKHMLDEFRKNFNNDDGIDPITKRCVEHILGFVPKRGDLRLEDVLESTYFFS